MSCIIAFYYGRTLELAGSAPPPSAACEPSQWTVHCCSPQPALRADAACSTALQLMGMSSAALTSRMLTDMQLLEADAGADT